MRRLSYRIVWAAICGVIVMAGPVLAEAPAWIFVEAGYNDINVDGSDEDGDGWFAGATFGGERWHAFGQFNQNETSDTNISIDTFYVGAGWHGLLGENADLFADLAYLDSEVGPVSDSGYFGRVGVRWRLIKLLELGASTRYQDVGDFDSDLVWNANAIVYVWKLGIGLSAEIADDIDTYNAFVRFNFN